MPYPGEYLSSLNGKTIKYVSSDGLRRMTLHFTDGSSTTIDACAENTKVVQEITLILNSQEPKPQFVPDPPVREVLGVNVVLGTFGDKQICDHVGLLLRDPEQCWRCGMDSTVIFGNAGRRKIPPGFYNWHKITT